MRVRRLLSGALVAGVLALTMLFGAAVPAQAVDWDNIENLQNYKLSVTGAQLYNMNTPAAKAAWGAQYKKIAATSANQYNAAAILGDLEYDTLGGLTDITEYPRLKEWAKTKRRSLPKIEVGLNKWSAALGAPLALTGYAYRGDIAGGVTSWFGIDAQGTVCADAFWRDGFANFLTGQDCSAWEMTADAVAAANADLGGGVVQGLCVSGAVAGDSVLQPEGVCSAGYALNRKNLGWGNYEFSRGAIFGVTRIEPVAGGLVEIEYRAVGALPAGSVSQYRGVGVHWACYDPVTRLRASSASSSFVLSGESGVETVLDCAQFGQIGGALLQVPETAAYGGGPTAYYPLYVEGVPFVGMTEVPVDAERELVCTYTFDDGSTGVGRSPKFRESSGVIPAPVCPMVPEGRDIAHVKITEDGGGNSNVLVDQDALPDVYSTTPEGFASPGTGSLPKQTCTQDAVCWLDLVVLPGGQSCFDMGAQCDGWMTDPDRDAKYKCMYGGQDTEVQQCYVYAQTFNPAKRVAGSPYSDPLTGEEVGKISPTADDMAMGRPVGPVIKPDGSFASCLGGTFSGFNPIQWILQPIQCGLQWAFVPRQAVVQKLGEDVAGSWDETLPVETVTMVRNWSPTGSGSGCSIPVTYDAGMGVTTVINLADACSGPLATVAGFSRMVLSAVTAVGCALAVRRSIAGIFGFNGE